MSYPPVDRSHVVPRGYLRNFAVDGRVVMHRASGGDAREVSLRDAGVRVGFYRRHRPDTGERIDDIEWTLSQVESDALPILANLRDHWPLDGDSKVKLASLLGYQMVRGGRWMAWHSDFTRAWADEQQAAGEAAPDEADLLHEHLTSDTPRLIRMVFTGVKVASILGSMHWALVEFRTPVLATSDHPVVYWPGNERGRKPQPPEFGSGTLNTIEAFVPVASDLAILMTWTDRPDDESLLHPQRHHAKTINAFVIAQAERQWFHAPGVKPPIGVGRLLPLSAELHRGYDTAAAIASKRRIQTADSVNARVGTDDNKVEIVFVTSP